MLNVNGLVKVCSLEERGNIIKGKLYQAVKSVDQNGTENWDNEFFNAVFVGKAIENMVQLNVQDKDKLNIISGVVRNKPYTNKQGETKTYLEVVVFELEKVVDQDNKKGGRTGWKKK